MNKLPFGFVLVWFTITLASFAGWVMNIVKLAQDLSADTAVTKMFIARIVGVFVPFVGAVLGYM